MSSEEDLFAKAMGKVRPIAADAKVARKQPRPSPAPVRSRQARPIPCATAPAIHSGDEPWILVANGISRERLRKFAAGNPAVERTVDLHGMNRDEAIATLAQQLGNALERGSRALCIIHGRGLHSQGRPVLRDAVYRWLKEGPLTHALLAVVPQPGSGGGACLVLLRRQS